MQTGETLYTGILNSLIVSMTRLSKLVAVASLSVGRVPWRDRVHLGSAVKEGSKGLVFAKLESEGDFADWRDFIHRNLNSFIVSVAFLKVRRVPWVHLGLQ